MGVRANVGMDDRICGGVEPELTLRIEVLEAIGVEHLSDSATAASVTETHLRFAVLVCSQVVYAATSLITQNPVRIG